MGSELLLIILVAVVLAFDFTNWDATGVVVTNWILPGASRVAFPDALGVVVWQHPGRSVLFSTSRERACRRTG
jgi:hypothetical protein